MLSSERRKKHDKFMHEKVRKGLLTDCSIKKAEITFFFLEIDIICDIFYGHVLFSIRGGIRFLKTLSGTVLMEN
jgi:hypothetical protein